MNAELNNTGSQRKQAPLSANENRRISARLNSLKFQFYERERMHGRSWGTMPAAFDPEEIANNIRPVENHDLTRYADKKIEIRLAETAWEYLAALNLLYEQYAAFGYVEENLVRVRINPWNLRPTTHTFIALHEGRVIGTLSMTEDEGNGLPADKLFPVEIQKLRETRRKLVEVSSFAVIGDEANSSVVMELIRFIATYARKELCGSDWVITVNPRHEKFYRKAMLFERLGSERPCISANGAPAVLLRLNLDAMSDRYAERYARRSGSRNLHRYFFEPEAEAKRLAALRISQRRRQANWGHIRNILQIIGGAVKNMASE